MNINNGNGDYIKILEACDSLGKTYAFYFIEDDNLFLINCGRGILGQLNRCMSGISTVYLMITDLSDESIGDVSKFLESYYFQGVKFVLLVAKYESNFELEVKKKLKEFGYFSKIMPISLIWHDFKSFEYITFHHSGQSNEMSIFIHWKKGRSTFVSGNITCLESIDRLIRDQYSWEHLYFICSPNGITKTAVRMIFEKYNVSIDDVDFLSTIL